MFQLVDVNTSTIVPDDYVRFLRRLLLQITRVDSNGNLVCRESTTEARCIRDDRVHSHSRQPRHSQHPQAEHGGIRTSTNLRRWAERPSSAGEPRVPPLPSFAAKPASHVYSPANWKQTVAKKPSCYMHPTHSSGARSEQRSADSMWTCGSLGVSRPHSARASTSQSHQGFQGWAFDGDDYFAQAKHLPSHRRAPTLRHPVGPTPAVTYSVGSRSPRRPVPAAVAFEEASAWPHSGRRGVGTTRVRGGEAELARVAQPVVARKIADPWHQLAEGLQVPHLTAWATPAYLQTWRRRAEGART